MAKPDGRVWFVFIGHGAPTKDGKDGLLVGVDAQSEPASLQARGVKRAKLLETLETGAQQRTVVVIDACFSGKTGEGQALAKGMQPVVPTAIKGKPKKDSTLVLSAAKANQFAGALPGAQRPAFSYLLLGALRGWADDGDGNVTAEEAIYWTRRQMRHLNHQQEPELMGTSKFVLTRGAKDKDPGISQLIGRKGRPKPKEGAAQASKVASTQKATNVTETNKASGACPEGKKRGDDTNGHCCWPGQVWAGGQCVGAPTSCPHGYSLDRVGEACKLPACKAGRVRMDDGVHCCWEGQGWASSRNECVGTPKVCKDGDWKECTKLTGTMKGSDPALAVELLRYACKGGHVAGCTELGDVYSRFIRTRYRNPTPPEGLDRPAGGWGGAAADLFKYSCKNGHAQGCFELAEMYESGEGVYKDRASAQIYYIRACKKGHGEGCLDAGLMLKSGGSKKNYLKYLKWSCDLGHERGCGMLRLEKAND